MKIKYIKLSNSKIRIVIKGLISNWKNSSEEFDAKLEEYKNNGITDIELYINSQGGSVFEAFEIYNRLTAFSGNITCELGATCASAATLIACASSFVSQTKVGFYMIHKPSVSIDGNEDDIKNMLELLAKIQKVVLKVYSEKTGLSESEISKMWAKDYWMTAEEAKAKGFIDAITEDTTMSIEDSLDALRNATGLPEYVKMQIINQNKTQKEMNLVAMITALGMSANSTENDVLQKIQDVKAKADAYAQLKSELEKQKKDMQDDKIKSLIDKAIAENKIKEIDRAAYTALANSDFEAASTALTNMKAQAKPNEVITSKASATDRNGWDYDKWMDEDPAGLAEMNKKQPEEFKALFEKWKNK